MMILSSFIDIYTNTGPAATITVLTGCKWRFTVYHAGHPAAYSEPKTVGCRRAPRRRKPVLEGLCEALAAIPVDTFLQADD